MSKYIIEDWAGNVCFHGREFEDFEDAWGFIREFYDDDEEAWGEYVVVPKGELRETRYLDPNDPRNGLRND